MSVLMDGVAGISDYQAKELLADRYYRLQIVFDPNEKIPMDAVSTLDRMDEIGPSDNISETVQWINDLWR
jgi:hypothetical protein